MVLVAGIIVCAVANEVVISHGAHHADAAQVAVLVGGPALYLLGNGLFKRVVYGRFPLSHLAGLVGLGALGIAAPHATVGLAGLAATGVTIVAAAWESLARRRGVSTQHAA